MGVYLNPGNIPFTCVRNSTYVDKSGLISLINRTINTSQRFTCVSHPRRFGKTFAAKMLCAYYDKGCNSSDLFSDLKIADDVTFRKNLNQYDVILIDVAALKLDSDNYSRLGSYISKVILRDLRNVYTDINEETDLLHALFQITESTGNQFIMIIDEWDAPIREEPDSQEEYLMYLRSLFMNGDISSKVFAAVYMTGILPIKRDADLMSTLSEFEEYSMLSPGPFAPYFGFTESEVRNLCQDSSMDFEEMKLWYDGYTFPEFGTIYNPYSVMEAIFRKDYDCYWWQTSAP